MNFAYRFAPVLGLWLFASATTAGIVDIRRQIGVVHLDDAPPSTALARPTEYVPPRGYVCYRATGPIAVDGKLNEAAWQDVPWTEDFVDIEGEPRPTPRLRTRVKMLWDDRYFYVAAELDESHVQASYTVHDSYIFHEDNDFEVFIDPDGTCHNYLELEMNALNTTWDLMLQKPYRDGGPALDDYEIDGLKTAVHIDGTLNDPRDIDKGWSVEIAFPWASLGKLSKRPVPPRDGDHWRVNFSRVQWRFDVADGKYRRAKDSREDNWVWSPQGAINMHMPELWGYVQFSTAAPGKTAFRPDPAGPAKHLLFQIYHAQTRYWSAHHRFARSLVELGFDRLRHDNVAALPRMLANPGAFHATADVLTPDNRRQCYRVHHDSLLVPVAAGE